MSVCECECECVCVCVCVYTGISLAIKKNEILTFATMGMELEGINAK